MSQIWLEKDEGGIMYTIKSKFIEVPTRKLAQIKEDLTYDGAIDELDISLYGSIPDPEKIKDSILKVEFKIFNDQSEKLDKKAIEEFYLSAGAKEVDVRIIRIPRENVRSERILKLTTLREKLMEMARLKGEIVPESILTKADILESEDSEKIISKIASL